jgi:hypothetical protein
MCFLPFLNLSKTYSRFAQVAAHILNISADSVFYWRKVREKLVKMQEK